MKVMIRIYGNKGGSLSATYNENGKLIRVIEKYKDVKLPLLLFILYTKPTQVGKLLMTGIPEEIF
jgi:hypothetical protein